MAFKIKDGIRVGTTDVFNNSGVLLVNAPTATKLATSRNINGVAFDGSADITITSANANALTIGTGLSGTSYNGSSAVTIAIDSTVATLTGTQTLTNKTLTSPTMTTPTLGVASATTINKVTITAPATGSTLTIADGKTLTANNTLTFTGTDASSVAFGAGGTVAYTSNKLSAFAATTSAELLGVISDETGSGSLVFGTSPTISAPTISGHPTIEGVTSTGATGTGNLVFSASPTFTGTVNAAAVTTTGDVNVGGNAVITGNLTVNGTTTTLSSTTLDVADKNITLAKVASPTDVTADGAGITVKGTTDKTFNWVSASSAWTSSENLATAAGKTHIFNGATSGTITLTPTAIAGSTTLTLPATTGTLITTGDTGTVTNAMLAGSIAYSKLSLSGSIVNADISSSAAIAVSKLAASTISGVTLGNNLNALTIGTGLSGTSYNGSAGVTIAIDSTVATLTGTQTLTNKTLGAYSETTGSVVIANNAVVQTTIGSVQQTAVDTFATASYRSGKYLVQITQGSNYQVSEILVIHNGTTTSMTEYGVLETNGTLATFAADISGGNVRLLVTMGSATSATINIQKSTLAV